MKQKQLSYREVMELYFKWLFEDSNPEPPTELVTSPYLTHTLIVSSFTLHPEMTDYIANRLTRFNIYTIPKDQLLKRIKELVYKFKVSKWDFWTLMNKKPHHDPLFRCLNPKFWVKASDIPLIKQVIPKEELDFLCSSKSPIKKVKNLSKELDDLKIDQTNPNNIHKQSDEPPIKKRLEAYKQWVIDQLKDKEIDPKYPGCINCALRPNQFVPPDYHIGDLSRDEVDIVFVGMNPYKDEIKYGKPFAGQSGKYLRKILQEKCSHLNYVITNTCMCFIPNNGDPTEDDIKNCRPLLIQQLKMLNPKVIVPLGALAAKNLIDFNEGITKVSGKVFEIDLLNE